jgi:hypothetical protein
MRAKPSRQLLLQGSDLLVAAAKHGYQGTDQQAPVGLDPHRHLHRILGMRNYQRMQLPHPS